MKNHELESAIKSLVFRMKLSSQDERAEVFSILRGQFCEHCGENLNEKCGGVCHCNNDE